MARGRGLGPAASGAAGAPAGRGGSGLGPGSARQRQPAREKGGAEVGSNPTDRGKPGTKRHLVTDARGTPLGLTLSGANRHDSRMLAYSGDPDRLIQPKVITAPSNLGAGSGCTNSVLM